MNKIATVIATLTARYGKFEPKDGQLVGAVVQSWEQALGSYAQADLQLACTEWMRSTRYPRWPEPGELLELLKGFGARPQEFGKSDMRPSHVVQAEKDAGFWWQGLLGTPLPSGAWPCRWDDAVAHVIGFGEARNKGKSFGWLLTQAWLNGTLPNGFEARASTYFSECQRRKGQYLADVKHYGPVAMHEGRVVRQP